MDFIDRIAKRCVIFFLLLERFTSERSGESQTSCGGSTGGSRVEAVRAVHARKNESIATTVSEEMNGHISVKESEGSEQRVMALVRGLRISEEGQDSKLESQRRREAPNPTQTD